MTRAGRPDLGSYQTRHPYRSMAVWKDAVLQMALRDLQMIPQDTFDQGTHVPQPLPTDGSWKFHSLGGFDLGHRTPYALRGRRHVDMLHAQLGHCIEDCVHHRR